MRAFLVTLTALGLAQTVCPAQSATITNQPVSRVVWAGCNVRFSVGVAGDGPFSYQWQLNTTNLPNGIITTVAGNGSGFPSGGFWGDGGAAKDAGFNSPFGVAVDLSGNIFIADTFNYRIRKVGIDGKIGTVAGGGPGFGEGGAATNAKLSAPYGIALDTSGNVFIAEDGNNVIREVSTNGIITTVAGLKGTATYSGDGGAATNASLFDPFGIAVDTSGNLFIADEFNNRIRKVDANGIISTVAGSGPIYPGGGFSGDGGPATDASLNTPQGVAVDAFGNFFIADSHNFRIRKVSTNGIITTIVGNGTNGYSGDGGPATNASLSIPVGVAVDSCGDLFIAENFNSRIRKVSANGIITTVAGNGALSFSGDGGPATNASLNWPYSVAVDNCGNLFIADNENNRIRKVTNTEGPTLAMNNVTESNAGTYQVVITGPGGGITSSVATLTVASSPLIYGTGRNPDGTVTLSLVAQPNSTNVVLSTTNISPPVIWQPLSTNLAGADGNWRYTDTNAASWQTRFYRSAQR